MSNYKAKMVLLADAIRSKSNISNKLTIENMISAVDNISTETGTDAYVVVDDNGVLKAQKLSFNGTEASFDGTAETLDTTKVGLFATTQDEPAYNGSSGGSGAFYKCASVDTEAKTWTGYLAVLGEDGVYTFEDTATEGLTFGNGYIPVVGSIYDAEALIGIKIWQAQPPSAGLVRYALLDRESESDLLGNYMIKEGQQEYVVCDGVNSVRMSGAGNYIAYPYYFTLKQFTMSVWMRTFSEYEGTVTFSNGNYGANREEVWLTLSPIFLRIRNGSPNSDNVVLEIPATEGWHHCVMSWSGSVFTLYLDGVKTVSDTCSYSFNNAYLYINSLQRAINDVVGGAYYAGLRMYNRVLTDAEVSILSSEFTPTT